MPRIPYVFPAPGESLAGDKLRERRKDGTLIALDGVFLNAPAIALGYSSLLGAIRQESSLDDGLRESLILRVAALNSAAYEWIAHEPIGRAQGLTDEQIAAIRDVSYVRASLPRRSERIRSRMEASTGPHPSLVLSPVLAAALAYTDAMTVHVKVPQDVFEALKVHLNDQQMMEATATVACYNMVSRVLVALDVSDMGDAEVPQAGKYV